MNADRAFYRGIDGKAAFRSITTRDQSWTLGRIARTSWVGRGLFKLLPCALVLLAAVLAGAGSPEARRGGVQDPSIIRSDELPPEARETLALIAQGGPFPYRRDGVVFSNRERRLPTRPSGYYREYTVPTPGARDRGARRIITGGPGEYYYTDDHYNSFRRIRE